MAEFDPETAIPVDASGNPIPKFNPETAIPVEPPTLAGEFGKGVKQGIGGMALGLEGLGSMAARAVGATSLSDKLARIAGVEEQAMQASAPAVGRIEDIGGLGDAALWAAGGLGQLAPFSVAAGAAGVVGGMAGRALAAPVGRIATQKAIERGATAGLSGMSVGQEVGGIYADQLNEIARERELGPPQHEPSALRALAYGIPAGALDVLPQMMVAKKVLGPAVKEGLTKTVLKQVGAEAATEGAQTGLERAGAFKPVLDEGGVSEILNAAALGGLGGGVIGGGVAGLQALAKGPIEQAVSNLPIAPPAITPPQAPAGATPQPPAGPPPVVPPAAPTIVPPESPITQAAVTAVETGAAAEAQTGRAEEAAAVDQQAASAAPVSGAIAPIVHNPDEGFSQEDAAKRKAEMEAQTGLVHSIVQDPLHHEQFLVRPTALPVPPNAEAQQAAAKEAEKEQKSAWADLDRRISAFKSEAKHLEQKARETKGEGEPQLPEIWKALMAVSNPHWEPGAAERAVKTAMEAKRLDVAHAIVERANREAEQAAAAKPGVPETSPMFAGIKKVLDKKAERARRDADKLAALANLGGENAVQVPGASGVLPHPPEGTGETGGVGQGVGPSVEGPAPTQAGQEGGGGIGQAPPVGQAENVQGNPPNVPGPEAGAGQVTGPSTPLPPVTPPSGEAAGTGKSAPLPPVTVSGETTGPSTPKPFPPATAEPVKADPLDTPVEHDVYEVDDAGKMTGKVVRAKVPARQALADIDERHQFAQAMLECLET